LMGIHKIIRVFFSIAAFVPTWWSFTEPAGSRSVDCWVVATPY
jgi:hypothetical protein